MTGIGVFGSALVSVLTTLAVAGGAMAGPVFCTTTVEAPESLPSGRGSPRLAPAVEITRCQGSQTVHELLQERFYSHTAPFEAGIGISHQITDLLGIARGGINGRAWMGFGFPDQTIVRDATAVQNTVQVLMEQQSDPMPWRTADLADVFTGSLSTPWQDSSGSMSRPARGL